MTVRLGRLLVIVAAIAAAALGYRLVASSSSAAVSSTEAVPRTVWPAYGQAAFVEAGQSQIHAGPHQHAAPIASVAKVMTAYLVLRDHPLRLGQGGPTITLSDADVVDTNRRRGRQESVVSVAAGEQLTELEALQALLLPSANNIAAVLARWDAGSAARFVSRMNATAQSLGMTHTRYTDPSGYDDATVSTAADQVRIVEEAMRLPVFASIVGASSATLPVAGTVYNTDALLGHDGFVGVKTGSGHTAGGCFAFRAVRWIDGRRTMVTGVVLGQPGHDQIAAGLAAADAMVDRIAGRRVTPGPGQRTLPPPAPPRRASPGESAVTGCRTASEGPKMRRTPHGSALMLDLRSSQSSEEVHMPKVSKATAKKEEFGPVTDCSAEVDGYRIGFATFHQDLDGTPLMKGLPDDMCQCPHWGYVFRGSVVFQYTDHDETYEEGDAFYTPPGHIPVKHEPGSEFLMFSPAEELAKTEAAIERNFSALRPA